MTAVRSRKQVIAYRRHQRTLPAGRSCDFCQIDAGYEQFLRETKHFKIIRNIFAYSLWDSTAVRDHLMIVPKQHTDTMADFTTDEAMEYVHLLAEYESQGYNVYARAPQSTIKSVVHQHTHLIKGMGPRKRFILFWRKPYVRVAL